MGKIRYQLFNVPKRNPFLKNVGLTLVEFIADCDSFEFGLYIG
jgi:hypothetical protein